MRSRKASRGRRGSAVESAERPQGSFDSVSSVIELDQSASVVHLGTSLSGTASHLDDRAGFPAEIEKLWFGDQPVEDRNNKNRGISEGSDVANPRSFPYRVKQQCWEKAKKVKGRDPDRWRLDPLGNIIFRKLIGCPGCLCHDYDHIVPYSKGGESTLANCQVLQATVNRSKGNKTEISKSDLIQKSAYCRISGRDMDFLEVSAYGNVRHGQDSGGCKIQ